jgi:hypothetical protein
MEDFKFTNKILTYHPAKETKWPVLRLRETNVNIL